MKSTRAVIGLEAVERIARSSLPEGDLMLEVGERVRQVVPFDSAGMLLLDPDTFLPLRLDELGWRSPTLPMLLARNERLSRDVHKWRELASRRAPIATLSSLGARASASERRTEILDPMGIGDELRVVARHDRTSFGAACLFRGVDARAFDDDEIAFVREAAAVLAGGLKRALSRRAAASAARAPGVILLDRELAVASMTAQAQHWQQLLTEQSMIAVRAVAMLARHRADGEAAPQARIRLRDGAWLTARAASLDGTDDRASLTAVTLAPSDGSDLCQLLLRVHGLTAREREVASLMISGLPTKAVATRMSISLHTLRSHLKRIFARVGVRSQAELIAALTGQAAVYA
ncbi:MAG TPA: helix-turn-helix transcriptional regulator [Conexibacter sp.]|jgi:DNA-binding CsgD family transcriptional regulator